MAAVTTNYGFDVPTSSDLVKNGATQIALLGQDLDTFLFRPFTRNGALNSQFNVWQRGTSIAVTTSAYTADRWQGYRAVAGSTVSRQVTNDTTNLPFIQYCARVQRDSGNTATSAIFLAQTFESVNSIPYAGKTITLSFYARSGANYSSASGILGVQLMSGTGTDQNYITGFTGSANPINTNATLTTTWQRFTYTAAVGSTVTQLATAFNFTPVGTAGANDYFEITGVMLEVGSQASPYAPATPTYATELAACQRYYYRSTTTNTYGRLTSYTPAASTTAVYLSVVPPVKPRVAITAVEYSNLALYDGTGVVTTISSISLGDSSNDINTVNVSCTGLTQYRPYALLANNNVNGYIGFSAEL
jgi:hypothetical protein